MVGGDEKEDEEKVEEEEEELGIIFIILKPEGTFCISFFNDHFEAVHIIKISVLLNLKK